MMLSEPQGGLEEADELAQTETALLKLEERARKGEEESAKLPKEKEEFLAAKQRSDDQMAALVAELAALKTTAKQPAPPTYGARPLWQAVEPSLGGGSDGRWPI